MRPSFKIELIAPTSSQISKLADEARAQGYAFVDRLIKEAKSGANIFKKQGECFCGVFFEETLIGFGGVNQDPYLNQLTTGRLRHIYVLQRYRRKGVATALVQELLRRSEPAFSTVRLRTSDEAAGRFYEALGFERSDSETATHVIAF